MYLYLFLHAYKSNISFKNKEYNVGKSKSEWKIEYISPKSYNLINLRSGIKSVLLGKIPRINKRTGYVYSKP